MKLRHKQHGYGWKLGCNPNQRMATCIYIYKILYYYYNMEVYKQVGDDWQLK